MEKRHLIDSIMQVNSSARADWLSRFDASALRRYLDHLMHALEPRGAASRWMRPADSRVVSTRIAS
jgi:hypothetical protein